MMIFWFAKHESLEMKRQTKARKKSGKAYYYYPLEESPKNQNASFLVLSS